MIVLIWCDINMSYIYILYEYDMLLLWSRFFNVGWYENVLGFLIWYEISRIYIVYFEVWCDIMILIFWYGVILVRLR